MTTYDWTGPAKSIEVWDGRMVEIGSLQPRDKFELWNLRWQIERQTRRFAFARCTSSDKKGCRVQLKKSNQVAVPYVAVRA